MKRWALLLLAAFIYIQGPVAAVQMDIETAGAAVLLVDNKQLSTRRLDDGKLRIIIFGLNQEEFEGRILSIDGDVMSISNVVGSSAGGDPVQVDVKAMNSPKELKVDS